MGIGDGKFAMTGPKETMVTRSSAGRIGDIVRTIDHLPSDTDHRGLVKFEHSQDIRYVSVIEKIRSIAAQFPQSPSLPRAAAPPRNPTTSRHPSTGNMFCKAEIPAFNASREDYMAASIDPTRIDRSRVLDPFTGDPLNQGVYVDPTRTVHARDFFNLSMFFEPQESTCKVEVLLRGSMPNRNDPPDSGTSDLLICRVMAAGRWLHFPPIEARHIIAVCPVPESDDFVPGFAIYVGDTRSNSKQVMMLHTEDRGVAADWSEMLGLLSREGIVQDFWDDEADTNEWTPMGGPPGSLLWR
ncbi:hypothetical protein LTR10_007384 [Elasticomyces elasticus]|nr:hypothetical protein LTR10_007384 [Elasticomyces elasticus]KAK4979195.1 hypothetical protein LTR42_001698 [Elasticomyces elasticus]